VVGRVPARGVLIPSYASLQLRVAEAGAPDAATPLPPGHDVGQSGQAST
jgi:hypothetical protein